MKYPAYPKYKPSGVEWLGEVPAHWEMKSLRYACRFAYGDSLAAEDREDGEVRVYGSNGAVGTHIISNTREPVIVVGRKGSYGKINYSERAVFAIDTTYFIDKRYTNNDLRWLFYMLGSLRLDAISKDSAVPGLAREDAYDHVLLTPPLSEQRAIADFLDRETAKLDTLVAKKRELIEKLKEKRTALISRTVTRGLPPEAARAAGFNPHPKFKPSGIEWLGEVPEHWEVAQLFRIAPTIQTGPFGSQLHQSDYIDDGIPLINPSHLINGGIVPDDQDTVTDETARRLARHILMVNDVVFARRGEIGRCAVVGEKEASWLCGTGSMVVRLKDCAARYFARVFRSAGFSALLTLNAVGTTMLNLNPAIVGRMRVPVPPLAEQRAIADYLDRETAKINQMAAKVEEALGRLQEYRTALITAAVTGKIDVRKYEDAKGVQHQSRG